MDDRLLVDESTRPRASLERTATSAPRTLPLDTVRDHWGRRRTGILARSRADTVAVEPQAHHGASDSSKRAGFRPSRVTRVKSWARSAMPVATTWPSCSACARVARIPDQLLALEARGQLLGQGLAATGWCAPRSRRCPSPIDVRVSAADDAALHVRDRARTHHNGMAGD